MAHQHPSATIWTLVFATILVLAGCAPAREEAVTPQISADGRIERLDFGDFGGGSVPQTNFNPFSPTKLITDYTFEPLIAFNHYDCESTPWLATAYEWQNPQSLVMTIREGVLWNDGTPFTPDDVVFTFNMLKAQAAFDVNGVWNYLESVSAENQTVVFRFKEPAVAAFERIATQIIVPRHIWEKEADPVKFTNPSAVGTGPFKPKSFNGRQLVLERNQQYWQDDKVRINNIVFHKSASGSQIAQLDLANGKFDMNAMFVPKVEQVYVARNPQANHYWYPSGGAISLGFNLTKAPFNDVAFRRAVAYGIDRTSIAAKAQYGYVEVASQTGLVLPGQEDWLDPNIADRGVIPYDPDQARTILQDAGYTWDDEGRLHTRDGAPVTFTFSVQNGWVDWIQAAQIIQQNLEGIGITVDVQTPSPEAVEANRAIGDFDMTFIVHGGTCSMYDNYFYHLDSSQSAPIGEASANNYIRWEDARTDELLLQLRQTDDEAQQKQLVDELQRIQFEQLPTIPLWYGAIWFQNSTRRVVGWPSAENPYAKPGDVLLIITSLTPATNTADS